MIEGNDQDQVETCKNCKAYAEHAVNPAPPPSPLFSSFLHVQVLEELIEENDQVPNVWLLLAVALRGAGELEGALEAGE